jgi:hypothetical protein
MQTHIHILMRVPASARGAYMQQSRPQVSWFSPPRLLSIRLTHTFILQNAAKMAAFLHDSAYARHGLYNSVVFQE